MSLTSYRAAPPRDKPLRAFKKTIPKRIWHNAGRRRSIRSGGFLRRLPLADANGCKRYVPTQTRFGKARRRSFELFMVVERRVCCAGSAEQAALVRKPANGQFWNPESRDSVRCCASPP